jgi:lipopolysaccharide transport system ATP-binding protein
MSSSINLENASVSFPIFNVNTYSLKNRIIKSVMDKIKLNNQHKVVQIDALKNINIKIQSGERIGVIGGNGSGKSTFLRLCSRIYEPSTGSININGNINSLINVNIGIDPESTGRENIKLRLVMLGCNNNQINEHFNEIIEFSELNQFIDLPFYTYSTGMQMRLAFATSVFIKPEILIMDEWLATADKDFQEKAKKKLNSFIKDSKILILASHSKDLILKTCTRVIWLENGYIKKEGQAEEIASAYFGG